MKSLISRRYPETHLLNPRKEYVHSTKTNIAETFARIRAEQPAQSKKIRKIR